MPISANHSTAGGLLLLKISEPVSSREYWKLLDMISMGFPLSAIFSGHPLDIHKPHFLSWMLKAVFEIIKVTFF
jgi:hypothetical protein